MPLVSLSNTSSLLFLLFLQVLHGYWRFAQWTRIIGFQPVLDAACVEEMLGIARQRSNFIFRLVFDHANRTLDVSIFSWFELLFNDVFQDVLTRWLPVRGHIVSVSISSHDCGGEANENEADSAALAHREVAEDDEKAHHPD